MRITILALAAICAGATVSSAWAQGEESKPVRMHQGFWIGGGLGYGSVDMSCKGCGSSDAESSVGGFLRLGGTLSEQVLLGVESDGWTKSIDGVNNTVGNLSAAVYLYPSKTAGVFVKGGVGLAAYEASSGGDKLSGSGLGVMGGVGYDIPIGTHTAITPVATVTYGDLGELSFNGSSTGITGVKQTMLQVALSITGY